MCVLHGILYVNVLYDMLNEQVYFIYCFSDDTYTE